MNARARQSGFTLIEIVAAFSILAIGLALSMSVASGSMQQARRSATFTEAALHARSLLDTLGAGERLEEGTLDGSFDERFDWQLDIVPYEPPPAEGAPAPAYAAMSPVELYQLDLVVRWRDGEHEREARFATLRALTPSPNR